MDIILRVFEYGFYHALESPQDTQDGGFRLDFPEPVVIYLTDHPGIPSESVLHINFQGQGSFDYHAQNFFYLRHSLRELEQKKLIILIPFQVLRIRSLLYDNRGRLKIPDEKEFGQLIEIIKSDIINAISTNLSAGNITSADAIELAELTNNLYEQIILHYQKRGGDQDMRPLLPGALRMPSDEFIFHVRDLEEKYDAAQKTLAILSERISIQEEDNAALTTRNVSLAEQNVSLAGENASLTEQNVSLAEQNASLTDENEKLKARIRELESSAPG